MIFCNAWKISDTDQAITTMLGELEQCTLRRQHLAQTVEQIREDITSLTSRHAAAVKFIEQKVCTCVSVYACVSLCAYVSVRMCEGVYVVRM
jgi:hypothetical protein